MTVEIIQLLIVLGKSQDTLIVRTTFHVLSNCKNWCLEYLCSSASGREWFTAHTDKSLMTFSLKFYN